jgi:predicted ATP-binding protein involved in virulence
MEGDFYDFRSSMVSQETEIHRYISDAHNDYSRRMEEGSTEAVISLPCVSYYKTSRLFELNKDGEPPIDVLNASDLMRNEGYRGSFDAAISFRRLRSWLDRQARIEYEEGKETPVSFVVRQAMAAMLEGVKDVRFLSRFLDAVVTFENGERRTLQQLSDGQRNLLALVGDIAMRMARLNPHLGEKVLEETEGVVLIDELDLHLHPEWQRDVVNNLKKTFPKIQFFVTTHSPFIIQSLSEGEHIPLDGQPVAMPGRYGIEEISRSLMGVERPDVGERYQSQVEAAKDYLKLIDEAAQAPAERLEEYKRLLAERQIPLAENPAYQAFLELKRAAKLGE